MMVISFEYFNVESGSYEDDEIEVEVYKEFTDWIEDHGIMNYKIIDIVVE